MKKILVVDDMAIVRDPIAATLDVAGYRSLCASTGADGIRLFKSEHPDLVLLDIHLPDMSGLQVLRLIRAVPSPLHVPVILLTADERRDCVLEAAKLGVQGYLIKSNFSLKDMLARISAQLDSTGTRSNPTTTNAASTSSRPNLSPITPCPPTPMTARKAPPNGKETGGTTTSVPDQLRSLKPIITRDQVLDQVDLCSELKALSPTVAQLLNMTGSADCSLEALARVIKRDQAISLKVLKVANSVVYKRGEPVDTIQKALSRIGVAQIRQVVLNISVIDNFRLSGFGEQFNSYMFWEHSIATGLIAAAITRCRPHDDRQIDAAFTMGLLHDVARMVFADQLGDMYKRVLDTASRLQLPLEQVETRMLLLNHADLMDRVLGAWKFPKAIVEPIGMHHLSVGNIRNLSPQMVAEVSTLALANRIAHALLLGSSGNDTIYPTEEFARILELKPEDIRRIEEQIPDQTTDMKYAMLQSGDSGDWPDSRQLMLKQFQRPMRPLYVSAEPEFDGYRMLFERLKVSGEENNPTVSIVHLASIRERESLSDRLLELERENGSDPLPLIIISQNGTLTLEPRIMENRVHSLLPSPFTIPRLAETVNTLLPPMDANDLEAGPLATSPRITHSAA